MQAAHECGQPGLSFALETFGVKDSSNVAERPIKVAIDHDIIIFWPVAHLVPRFGHAGADHLFVVERTGVQPPRQLAAGWRQQEHADEIVAGALAQLLRSTGRRGVP